MQENSKSNARKICSRQREIEMLRESIKAGDSEAYPKLQKIIRQVIYIFCAKSNIFRNLHRPTLVHDTTQALWQKIANGEFDEKKINFNILCKEYVFQHLSENIGIDKNGFRRICRLKSLSKKYNIPLTINNAYKFVELTHIDGYSCSLGMTEVIVAIQKLINCPLIRLTGVSGDDIEELPTEAKAL